jgi:SAM-dependent methyltransferase
MTLEPIDYYDATQWEAGGERRYEQREQTAISLLSGALSPSGGSFLDVGCGDGSFMHALDRAQRLAERGWNLTGIDLSTYMLDRASALPYRFEHCNLEQGIPFDAYNRVLFFLGIQPLYYETSTKTTAIGAGPLRRIKRGTAPVGHLRVFNRRALIDILTQEGFEVLKIAGAIMPVLPRPVQLVDARFNRFTSLASEFIVLARRA